MSLVIQNYLMILLLSNNWFEDIYYPPMVYSFILYLSFDGSYMGEQLSLHHIDRIAP